MGFDVSANQDGISLFSSPFMSNFNVFVVVDKLQRDINASVSQVVHQLINLLRDGHPEDRVRGCYHALFLISEKYSFPANIPQLGMQREEQKTKRKKRNKEYWTDLLAHPMK